jgi:succinate dehydrogenase / fumarate reductase cytochrome b subunit
VTAVSGVASLIGPLEKDMSRFTAALRSSVGSKVTMALTGIALLGFVVAHMVGNLQVYAGPEKLNAYAHLLQSLGAGLWVMRLGLLAIFVLHVATAIRLWRANDAARPAKYAVNAYNTSTYASRTMIWSGFIVLAFVVFHLLHFTLGKVQPDLYHLPDALDPKRHDVYRMVVLGFRDPVVALSYVVAQVLLCLHISHGASSLFQSLGCTSPRLECVKKAAGPVLAAVIAIGNISIPVTILLGLVGSEVR